MCIAVPETFSPPALLPPISRSVASACCGDGADFEMGKSSPASKRASRSSGFTYTEGKDTCNMFKVLP